MTKLLHDLLRVLHMLARVASAHIRTTKYRFSPLKSSYVSSASAGEKNPPPPGKKNTKKYRPKEKPRSFKRISSAAEETDVTNEGLRFC
ncbi:hypothetical protein V8C35DRAFT_304927 [Trichoderma chlorosporum]